MTDTRASAEPPSLRLIEGGFDELYQELFRQMIFGSGDGWKPIAARLFVERSLTAVPSTVTPAAD